MEILEAARKITGVSWNMRDGELEQAEDGSPRVPVPTMEQLQPLIDAAAYVEERRKNYPPITDQLDALWKGGTAFDDMQAKVLAVKAKYPKPE